MGISGKTRKSATRQLKKGRQLFVEGRLQNREYETKVDGRKHRRTEIVASRVQFLGARPSGQIAEGAADDSAVPAQSDMPF